MEDAVGAVPENGDAERFVRMLHAHVAVIVDNVDLVAVLMHERAEIAKLNGLNAARRRQDYSKQFITAYEEGVRAGRLRDIDAWTVTNSLLASANATATWYRGRDRRRFPAGVASDHVLDILVGGILIPSATPVTAA
jgi:hypothetical protein